MLIDLGAWGKGESGHSQKAVKIILVRDVAGLYQGSGSRDGMEEWGTFHLEHKYFIHSNRREGRIGRHSVGRQVAIG